MLWVKTGDKFKVVFKSNSVPYRAWSRVHYLDGTSFVSKDKNGWTDWVPLNKTVCLKVYTVVDDTKMINNKDISVDYDSGSYFSVKVVTADGRLLDLERRLHSRWTVWHLLVWQTITVTLHSKSISSLEHIKLHQPIAVWARPIRSLSKALLLQRIWRSKRLLKSLK